jgi:hypothetical protein
MESANVTATPEVDCFDNFCPDEFTDLSAFVGGVGVGYKF